MPDGAAAAREAGTYTGAVNLHLKLLEVEPVAGFLGVQVVVVVPGGVAEAVEGSLGGQQEAGGGLLVGHPRVSSFPFPASGSCES